VPRTSKKRGSGLKRVTFSGTLGFGAAAAAAAEDDSSAAASTTFSAFIRAQQQVHALGQRHCLRQKWQHVTARV